MVRKGGLEPPRVLPHQILNLNHQRVICDETLININEFPDFSLPKNVKDYERFSFVTGEKQETESPTLLTLLASTPANATPGHPDEVADGDVLMMSS